MKQKAFLKHLALALCVALLSGAILGCRPQPKLSTAGDYEQFHASQSSDDQQRFDELSSRLFKDEVTSSLINLHYTLTRPADFGISEYPITFGSFSLEQMAQDRKDLKDLKDELSSIDKSRLSKDSRLTYDILESYVDTELSSEGLELYYQPVSPTVGIQAQLPILLCEYAFYQKQDVEDYLGLLSQMDAYYAEILAFEQKKAEAGLFMSEDILNEVLDSCKSYTVLTGDHFMAETFRERLATLSDVTEEEKSQYTARHDAAIQEHFLPAYTNLMEGLEALRGYCTPSQGLCGLPEGKRYYEYLLASSIATSYRSVKDLRTAIVSQMAADSGEIARIISQDTSLASQIDTYDFKTSDPKEILEDLKVQIKADFPELPDRDYQIKYVPKTLEGALSPAFYLTPPLDLPDQNVIYINGSEAYESSDLYTMLAHEGYPGHLYQNVYFNEHATDHLRSILSYTSYSEGWATYVERYSYTLDNGLSPSMGQLLAANSTASLALHALLDININYYGWTKEQVADYLKESFMIDDFEVVDNFYTALTANPTNYLEYYVGYLEINNMRKEAEKKLGGQFDLKKFHTFLLDIGPAPFEVIHSYFQTWLMTYQL